MRENNAYAVFDIAAKQYTAMKGLPLLSNAPADFSDTDNKINIHATTSHKILMPDQVASFTKDGKYYFITANEGGTRGGGGEDMLGVSGDFKGEEIGMSKLPCTDAALCRAGPHLLLRTLLASPPLDSPSATLLVLG